MTPFRALLCSLLLVLGAAAPAAAQAPADTTAPADSLWRLDMAPVVVTATRAERRADEVAVPVSVIGQEEMASQGAARMTDLLADQPGLTINTDHGAGLQMRGLGPDYTLILVDGEPIVGRTAGTLDLDRLTTGNVERVEIVRGPTSSLYGSEALAGVVNLITEAPDEPLGGRVRTRYGTHGTVDVSARLEGTAGPWRGAVFVDRYRTAGYDLAPGTLAPTRPGYVDYTAQSRGQVEATERTTLSLRGRLATQSQDYAVGVGADGTPGAIRHTQRNERLDWNGTAGGSAGWARAGPSPARSTAPATTPTSRSAATTTARSAAGRRSTSTTARPRRCCAARWATATCSRWARARPSRPSTRTARRAGASAASGSCRTSGAPPGRSA